MQFDHTKIKQVQKKRYCKIRKAIDRLRESHTKITSFNENYM